MSLKISMSVLCRIILHEICKKQKKNRFCGILNVKKKMQSKIY